MKRLTKIFFGLILIVIIACSKDDEIPFSAIPKIELLKLSHDTIRQYQDVMTITIEYTDGNGDLGFVEPDKYALFIRDVRLAEFDGFYIGPLAPPDTTIAIRGILDIELPSLFIFGNASEETTSFELKMVDRSGNESNLLTTNNILITKP